jgi:DMSO/TMAO reductase YedYZ heme-binding membrane subunit
MKYLTLIVLLLVISYAIGEFVFKDRSAEGLTSAADKWKDLGRRIHQSVGIIAVLMIIILVARFIYHTIDSHW